MKKIATLLLFNLIAFTVFSQGINFEHGTLQQALNKAQKENKLVFVDTYTTWCGPCKWMTKEIFPQKEVGDFFNKNFVSIKIDCENGEGVNIAKKYGVQAYPTLLFLNDNGNIVHTLVGGKDASNLIQGGKNALDPNKRSSNMAERYANGERDLDFVLSYVTGLDAAYNRTKSAEVCKELLATMPIEKFTNKDLFKVVTNAGVDYKSKEYNYVLENKKMLLKKVDSTQYFSVINGAIIKHLNKTASTCGNIEELNAEIERCKKDNVSKYQSHLEKRLVYSFYLSQKKYDKWFDLKLAEAEKLKGKPNYVYVVHAIGDEVYKNPKFYGSDASLQRAIKIGHQLADDKDGIIMGSFMLAKLYLKVKNKEQALKYFNTFYTSNEKAGGLNDHPSVSSVKNGIDSL
ncbi:thioredoxin family protein [Cellulophaga lytica]|uniref:thioredoxin family protein n=1 Tax=Cellulophaga lytica TaxID=979 RepID=UPI0032E51AAE